MGERQRYRERHSKRQRGRRESGRQAQEGRGGVIVKERAERGGRKKQKLLPPDESLRPFPAPWSLLFSLSSEAAALAK